MDFSKTEMNRSNDFIQMLYLIKCHFFQVLRLLKKEKKEN